MLQFLSESVLISWMAMVTGVSIDLVGDSLVQ